MTVKLLTIHMLVLKLSDKYKRQISRLFNFFASRYSFLFFIKKLRGPKNFYNQITKSSNVFALIGNFFIYYRKVDRSRTPPWWGLLL